MPRKVKFDRQALVHRTYCQTILSPNKCIKTILDAI